MSEMEEELEEKKCLGFLFFVGQKKKNLFLDGDVENFLQRVERVFAANWISLQITNVVVCCNNNPNHLVVRRGVLLCHLSLVFFPLFFLLLVWVRFWRESFPAILSCTRIFIYFVRRLSSRHHRLLKGYDFFSSPNSNSFRTDAITMVMLSALPPFTARLKSREANSYSFPASKC